MKLIITTTLTIAKPQRLALFLITLFLLPSTAWGQAGTYGISIAGTALTSENYNPTTGAVNNMEGVTFDFQNSILTLEKVTIESDSPAIESSLESLTIKISGNNNLSSKYSEVIRSNKSNATLKISRANSSSTLMLIPSSENKAITGSTSFDGVNAYSTDTYSTISSTDGSLGDNGKAIIICSGTPYGFYVGGTIVTSDNKGTVLGSGVDYIPGNESTATLKFSDNATIPGDIEWDLTKDLTIEVYAGNTIQGRIYTFRNTPRLYFTYPSGSTDSNITIGNSEGDNSAIEGFLGIIFPEDNKLKFDENLNYVEQTLRDEENKETTLAHISYHYGLSIYKGNNILMDFSANKSSFSSNDGIDGFSSGSISFDNSERKLTLTGVTIADGIILWDHIGDSETLKIALSGNSTITCETPMTITQEGGTQVTTQIKAPIISRAEVNYWTVYPTPSERANQPYIQFTSADQNERSLILSKKDVDNCIQGFKYIDNSVTDGSVSHTKTTESGNPGSATMLISSEFYNVWVNGIPVHGTTGYTIGYKDNVTGENNAKEEPLVTYDSNENILTLNGINSQTGATIKTNGTNAIESNLDNLTVHLVGENIITCQGNSDYAFKGRKTGAKVTFTTGATSPGLLQGQVREEYMFDNITPIYQGGLSYQGNGDSYTISITDYGITINDVAITSAYVSSDGTITGIGGITDGVVKFTPADDTASPATPATLTLNGATTLTSISTSLSNLKIILQGTNNITTGNNSNGICSSANDGTLTFSAASGGSLEITSTASAIRGFNAISGLDLETKAPYVIYHGTDVDDNYYRLKDQTASSDTIPITWVMVSEAQTYQLWVTGIQVTSQNAATGIGGNSHLTYANGTITLNGYNGTYTAGDFIVSNLSDGLTVNLKGSNSVKVGDGTTNHFAIKNVSASTPYLTFITDNVETPGTFKVDSYASGGPFSGFNSDVNWPKDSNNQLISEGTAMNNNIFVISPDLMVGGKRIVTGNSYTFGEGTVSYTYQDSKNILTLDGAVISGEIECRYDNLTVYLKGENEINPSNSQNSPFSYIGDMVSGTLTFESSEADDGELTLSGAFSETGSSPNKKITSGGYTTTTEFDTGLSYTFGDWIIETSKIYYNPHYGITINSYETTKCNKDNITKTNSGGVFTYSPQAKTLSIPLDYDGSSTDIKSQRDDLIVSISGNTAIRSIIHEPSQSGTLLIKNAPSSSSTVNELTLQNSTGAVISGFSTVTLDGLYFLTPNYPSVTTSTDWTSSINEAIITNETLSAPTMSSETVDGVSTLTLTSTAGNVPIKYSIDYVDASQTDITDAIYDSSHKPTISKPATVTAKVTLNEVESATTTGKYFGTNPSPFTLISGTDPIDFDLAPAIVESDGISITSISGIESNVTYDAATRKISSSTMGSFNGQVSMSSTEGKTVILNNNFTATFTVQIDISNAVIKLDNEELAYNGKEQSVNVTQVLAGDIEVAADYYEVSDNSGTEVGNYTLTVTAKTRDSQGNPFNNIYTGTATKVWKITNHYTATATELGFSTETQTASTYYNPSENFNLPEGYVGYIITGVEGSKVLTTRISYIPKGIAVLVEKGTSAENPIEEIPDASEQPLKGTSEPLDVTSITGGIVYVLYNGMFVKSTSGTIPEKRCYLLIATNVAAGTRGFTIDHGEGTTALRGVPVEGTHGKSDAWYTLQGRRLSAKPTAPGLYLHNGIKVVIK